MIITVVNRVDFASYVPSRSAAVLRIYDPVEDYAEDAESLATAGWGQTLPVAFWDIGALGMKMGEAIIARLLGRWRRLCLSVGERLYGMGPEIPWRPFLAADACEIARFADELPAKGINHLMVVCGNGRARSWTVAKWLSGRLGGTLMSSHGWQRESASVASVLRRMPAARVQCGLSAGARFEPAE